MGNGKWEIDCVLPHERMGGSVETGNGKLLPNESCQGPSGKWEMGNWMWMRRIGQVGNGKWEIAEWEIGCCAAASIRETGTCLRALDHVGSVGALACPTFGFYARPQVPLARTRAVGPRVRDLYVGVAPDLCVSGHCPSDPLFGH